MPESKHIIVGTAGHIDHGKSALIKALTGTDPDRLAEEKRRGITIDLGFAFLQLEDVCLGFVDVPGHERFVRNMLAGAGGMDMVVLVIAADESIKPQTREHFDICGLLGISRGLVALTKIDLVHSDVADMVQLEVEEFVRRTFLEGAPVVPVSSRTGAGLERMKSELLRIARDVPARSSSSHFRLPIDRAFIRPGFGSVVTGTLVSGSVAPQDLAEVFPARKNVRIRGVHSAGQSISRAVAGQRTAVNVVGAELQDLTRGSVLAAPDCFQATRRLDARLKLLAGAPPLRNRARVRFHHGTAATAADVLLLKEGNNAGSPGLSPGESALAQIRLNAPILLLPGDRFIIRQFSPAMTIGGGVVLDALPRRHRRKDDQTISDLQTLESGDNARMLLAFMESAPAGLNLAQVTARTGWIESTICEAAAQLARSGQLWVISEEPFHAASSAVVANLQSCVLREVDKFHADNPLARGLSREQLRARLGGLGKTSIFPYAIEQLLAQGEMDASGEAIRRAGHAIKLAPEEQRAKEMMEAAFQRSGFAAPDLADVLASLPVEKTRAEKVAQILIREGILVKVGADLFFHASALNGLPQILANHRRTRGPRISVTEFKALTGATRKYAIPLLEYLDRKGLTRRDGDQRVIL